MRSLLACFLGSVLVVLSVPASAAAIGTWGIDLSDQDRSVKPGDNFAMYQNGGWFRRTELKPGQSAEDVLRQVLRQIVKLLANISDLENGVMSCGKL